MVDLGREGDLGRLERVVGRERDREEEDAARVGRVALQGAQDKPRQLGRALGRAGREREGRTGPMMVACQLNRLSPVGPAEHDDGGSRPRSRSSSEEVRCGQHSFARTIHLRAARRPAGRGEDERDALLMRLRAMTVLQGRRDVSELSLVSQQLLVPRPSEVDEWWRRQGGEPRRVSSRRRLAILAAAQCAPVCSCSPSKSRTLPS